MFRLVVIILDHKTSLPFILVNLVVWYNYFRWFRIVYFGIVSPLQKRQPSVGDPSVAQEVDIRRMYVARYIQNFYVPGAWYSHFVSLYHKFTH